MLHVALEELVWLWKQLWKPLFDESDPVLFPLHIKCVLSTNVYGINFWVENWLKRFNAFIQNVSL